MIKKIVRWFFALIGALVGFQLIYLALKNNFFKEFINLNISERYEIFVYAFCTLLFGLIFYVIFPFIANRTEKLADSIEMSLEEVKLSDLIIGTFGLIIGLLLAMLVSVPIKTIPFGWVADIISILVYILLGYLGLNLSTKRKDDLLFFLNRNRDKEKESKQSKKNPRKISKVLDTSVIIDGRIFDVCKTGFVEGPLVIPTFVLNELQYIADSSDALKRNRGRRGLDVLNKIQKELPIEVKISEKDYANINEVDSKLLKLAQEINGKVITNDYNLNKVAEFKGVDVLNVNELANAIKPIVLPGEEMVVHVIKDGKESGQGVAYLDDGTMIVVEGGKKFVGKIINVMVTSILQTAAGRMIFAKPKRIVNEAS